MTKTIQAVEIPVRAGVQEIALPPAHERIAWVAESTYYGPRAMLWCVVRFEKMTSPAEKWEVRVILPNEAFSDDYEILGGPIMLHRHRDDSDSFLLVGKRVQS